MQPGSLFCLSPHQQGHQHLSTEDLRERVNEELEEMSMKPVSRRTIELDLNYLENGPFAADIEHYHIDEVSQTNPDKTVTKLYHRYRDRSFSIFQQKMSEEEKVLLREAMSLLGQFDGLPNLDRLEALRSGLDIRPARQIISFTKNPLENSNLLGELFTSISQRLVLELHYHLFNRPLHESQRNISGDREAGLRRRYPMLTGGRFFSIECIENYELIRELTSFREDLIVLSPDNIRDTVMERIAAMYEMYKPWRK